MLNDQHQREVPARSLMYSGGAQNSQLSQPRRYSVVEILSLTQSARRHVRKCVVHQILFSQPSISWLLCEIINIEIDQYYAPWAHFIDYFETCRCHLLHRSAWKQDFVYEVIISEGLCTKKTQPYATNLRKTKVHCQFYYAVCICIRSYSWICKWFNEVRYLSLGAFALFVSWS